MGVMLPRRQLGKTGIEISAIGLGTVKLGRNVGVKYPTPFEIPSDEDVRHLLDGAQELGINLIDTAPAYGNSEGRIGALLRGHRNNWVICTKAGEEFDGETRKSSFDFSPEAIERSVMRSLQRLETDRLDVVLLHSDGRDAWILRESGALEALIGLKDKGVVQAVGISAKTVDGALLGVERTDVVMITLNERERESASVIEKAAEVGCGVLVKKVFASGHGAQDAGGVERALEFALSQVGVASVVVGTVNPGHLAQNVEVAERVIVEGV